MALTSSGGDRFEILRPLGRGGMGEVFLARDHRLGRDVAIKRLFGTSAETAQKRILHEARALAQLNHPHIAAVYDVFDDGERINLVMEYVDGEPLSARLRRGALAEADVVTVGRQTAEALAYAHAHGVVHCDIKPSNLLLNAAGEVKVLDFGIAAIESTTATTAPRTTSGRILRGTPGYMAPELLLGAPASPLTDLYALGITLFELASGRRPLLPDPAAMLQSPQPRPRLSDIAAGISPALDAVIDRAIDVDPTRRFASATAMRAALDAVVAVPGATGAGTAHPARSARRALGPLAALLTATCVALLVAMRANDGSDATSASSASPAVIGVLATNDTGDAANDFLPVGLTDVVVSRLVSAPGVTVVPRAAVLPYVQPAARVSDAMRDLGLSHALTVGVQRSGATLRFTTGLVAAPSTAVLWASSLSGPSDGMFELQQRVADAALRALRAHGVVSAEQPGRARTRPFTADAAAFESYASGRTLLERTDVPGNLARALHFLEQAVQRDATFVAGYAALGEAQWLQYRASRDPQWIAKARASILEAVRMDPGNASVLYSLAVLDHGAGRLDDAIADLEGVLSSQPASDEAYRLLGRIHAERREFDRAVDALREAERLRPAYPATVRALALAYYDAGRLPEAIAAATRLTTLQPDSAPAFQLLGTTHHAAGELDQALTAYQRANQIAPRATAYSNIGVIHHARRQYEQAAAAYRQALALQPKEPTTHRNLADALWMTGDRRQAAAEYGAAIALARNELEVNANQPRVRALLAFCEAKLGHAAAARAAIDEALQQAPDDFDVVYKQAVIEVLGGRLDAARTALSRAVQLGYSTALLDADRDLDPLRPLSALTAER